MAKGMETFSKVQLHEGSGELHPGLTSAEVAVRKEAGQVNVVTTEIGLTDQEIITKYIFTLFNALNLTLFALILIAGRPLNGTFAFVIIMNTASGVFQELKAKKTLEKLTLLNTFPVEVLRDGQLVSCDAEEVVLDDVVYFQTGQQIIVDGVICAEQAELNEALLTGESDTIAKQVGDMVYSGSFVSSGAIYVQTMAVGDDMYINRIAHEAKKFKMVKSPLLDAINKIVKIIILIMLPVGTVLLVTQLFVVGNSWQDAIVRAVGGIVGMIPEGLVLLTTIAFLVGISKLSKYKTLVQDMPAIEMLARIDVLCLDKTGTITEGALSLVDVEVVGLFSRAYVEEALGALGHNIPMANSTLEAVATAFTVPDWKVQVVEPFATQRKWSGAEFAGHGTWILGAPEFVVEEMPEQWKEYMLAKANDGFRVLALCHADAMLQEKVLPADLAFVALLTFTDVVRENAADTLAYFHTQGVHLKIISGDNPATVAAVAKRAGVEGADAYIDARELPEDVLSLQRFVQDIQVFGRVNPEQKQVLIQAMQANGSIVGMTGDGVNDVLALKQADCAIAMASGSEAARSVAQIVLLHSDFAALPKVVDEGRKIVNNIERVASLYLIKSLYSLLLSFFAIIFLRPYPFQPIQLTLIGSLMVGIPTFFLALQPDTRKITGSFFEKVITDTIPGALTIVSMTIITQLLADVFGVETLTRSTFAIGVLGGVQFIILMRVSFPWKPYIVVLFTCNILIFISCFFVPFLQNIFGFTYLTLPQYLLLASLIIAGSGLFAVLKYYVQKIYNIKVK